MVNAEDQVPDANMNLIILCRDLVPRTNNVKNQLSPRSTNRVADALAKMCREEDNYCNTVFVNPLSLLFSPSEALEIVVEEEKPPWTLCCNS